MMSLRYLQMDVFANRPGAGNTHGALINGERLSRTDADDHRDSTATLPSRQHRTS